jgi:hypothetical protein
MQISHDILLLAMKSHFLPRSLVILLSILVTVTFFIGMFQSYSLARAVSNPTVLPATDSPTATLTSTPQPTISETPTLGEPTAEPTHKRVWPPTPTPPPISLYADTIHVTSLAIVLVVVILVGVIIGERNLRRKKNEPKE